MKTCKLLILLAILFTGVISCNSDSNNLNENLCTLIIASKKIMANDPTSSNTREYLAIKMELKDKFVWSPLNEKIVGFQYEEGFEYEILVKKEYYNQSEMNADAPSFIYVLEKIISKTKKDSEGI